jgi:epoxide hydrolase-like predicted phosphatase
VIFDLGGVLITWRPREIIDAFYADPELRAAVRARVFQHPDWLDLDRGTLDEQTAAKRFAARMARPAREMAALFDHVRSALLPVPAAVALLEQVHARGLSVYALSNISVPMFRHVRARNRFFDLFHGIVVSADVKLLKPDPAIFEHAVQRFDLACGETVFIDDLRPNVESARQLGLEAILFENPAQCAAELDRLLAV